MGYTTIRQAHGKKTFDNLPKNVLKKMEKKRDQYRNKQVMDTLLSENSQREENTLISNDDVSGNEKNDTIDQLNELINNLQKSNEELRKELEKIKDAHEKECKKRKKCFQSDLYNLTVFICMGISILVLIDFIMQNK